MTESYEAKARKWLRELKGRTLVWHPRDAVIAFASFLDSEKAQEAKQEKKECCEKCKSLPVPGHYSFGWPQYCINDYSCPCHFPAPEKPTEL